MSYDEFVCKICDRLNEMTGERIEISVYTAVKNNSCERKGVVFKEKGNNVSPTIYLEEYYEKFLEEQEIEKIAYEVVKIYDQVKIDHSWEEEFICDFENVKDKIIFRLINMEKNETFLNQIPFVKYMDFAIVFSVLLELDQKCGQIAMMQVRNEHLELWGACKEELYQRAIINSQNLLPFEFQTMFAVIADMIGNDESNDLKKSDDEGDLFVLSNIYRNCGAISICYPGVLEMIGERLDQNYFILPSSIHEVIIVPESESISAMEMKRIVKEVNDTYVHKEEYLSDNVYYFDREQNRLIG